VYGILFVSAQTDLITISRALSDLLGFLYSTHTHTHTHTFVIVWFCPCKISDVFAPVTVTLVPSIVKNVGLLNDIFENDNSVGALLNDKRLVHLLTLRVLRFFFNLRDAKRR